MRHIYTLLFILSSVTITQAQPGKPAPVITRYYYFTGTIDKYPVSFHLYRTNERIFGTYYYSSTEEPIEVYGELDKNNAMKLSGFDHEGEQTEKFSGNFKDSSFSGTWLYKGKLRPFRIAQKKNNSVL